MVTVITKTGPWDMIVYVLDNEDVQNPLCRLGRAEIDGFPFGALELSPSGTVLAYNNTEPGDSAGSKMRVVGRNFLTEIVPRSATLMLEEFSKGVAEGGLNIAFDCSSANVPYRMRFHFKVSPIRGTFWVFVKKIQRDTVARGS